MQGALHMASSAHCTALPTHKSQTSQHRSTTCGASFKNNLPHSRAAQPSALAEPAAQRVAVRLLLRRRRRLCGRRLLERRLVGRLLLLGLRRRPVLALLLVILLLWRLRPVPVLGGRLVAVLGRLLLRRVGWRLLRGRVLVILRADTPPPMGHFSLHCAHSAAMHSPGAVAGGRGSAVSRKPLQHSADRMHSCMHAGQ